jgi:hypothetical protein
MSGQDLNEFGKRKYKSDMQFEAILASTKIRNILPNTIVTDRERDNHAPFTRFYLENASGEIIQVSIDGQGLGDDTIVHSVRTINVAANNYLEIEPSDNLQFTMVCIKNLNALTDTVADEVRWFVSNY